PAAAPPRARRLRAMGCAEISLGETLGRGRPERVARMLEAVLGEVPAGMLAGHFHDTGGLALENIRVALAAGVRVFDAAVGGLGGCPYAPGAPGNVASEAVLALLEAEGFETGVDAELLAAAGEFARGVR
ncbi:MAG: hydroxymethylglutaryl-CoA lyase, partial [Pseudomonadota bacterium]